MAVSTVTITITNTKKKPTVLGAAAIDTTVISPTGITTPDTPYTEYVADSLTVTDGALDLPLYPRGQITKLPAASILTIQTDDYNEAAYYATLSVEDAKIELSTNPLQLITITLDKTTVAITGTGTSTITATTNPAGGTVTWKSSNTAVATVSDAGVVQGVAEGTATITATSVINGVEVSADCVATIS